MGPIGLRLLGGVAAAGPVTFTVAWVVAASFEPDYSARRDDISALAAVGAANPWITMSGEVALGVAAVVLAVGVLADIGGRDVQVGAWLLAVGGDAVVVQALAREDCVTALAGCERMQAGAASVQDTLHGAAAALAFMALVAAPLVFVRPFRQDPRWRGAAGPSLAAAVVGTLLLLGSALTSDSSWGGLAQRLLVTVPAGWLAATGLRLAYPERSRARGHMSCSTTCQAASCRPSCEVEAAPSQVS